MTLPERYDTWRKSSYSSNNTACVEVALETSGARVRDTKRRDAGHIEVAPSAWQALLDRL